MIRLLGVAAIFAFTILSFLIFDRTVKPENKPVDLQASEEGTVAEETDGSLPEFLSFAAEIEPGEYRISDPVERTQVRLDRDIRQRNNDIVESGRTPLDDLSEVDPGIYTTDFEVKDCGYAFSAVHEDRIERDIGTDTLPEGRMITTIGVVEPDRFTADSACGTWSKWSPLSEQLTSAPNGDYWTGDLTPGIWRVPAGCLWEKVIAFRGSRLSDVEESGIGPIPLEVDSQTTGVRIRGCSSPAVFASSS